MTDTTRETFQTHILTIDGVEHLPTWAIGQRITFPRIGIATVQIIRPMGTIDVERDDGKWFRVTGLSGTNWGY